MPSFDLDYFDIDPDEFVSACNTREIRELIDTLVEDGHLKKENVIDVDKPTRYNMNDEIFWESLQKLSKCRDLLSITEEEFINNLAKRFQHIR